MPLYKITATRETHYEFEIEAETEKEAVFVWLLPDYAQFYLRMQTTAILAERTLHNNIIITIITIKIINSFLQPIYLLKKQNC